MSKPDTRTEILAVKLTVDELARLNQATARRMLTTHGVVTRSTIVRDALNRFLDEAEAAKAA